MVSIKYICKMDRLYITLIMLVCFLGQRVSDWGHFFGK